MKIHFERKAIESALQKTIKAVSSRSPLPILGYVLIKTEKEGMVSFSTTDLEFGVRCKIKANIEEEGSACVPAKIITDLVGQLNEDKLTMVTREDLPLELTTSKSKYHINTRDADEFPIFPQPQDNPLFSLPQVTFREMIKNVVIAVAPTEEQRAALTGVFLQADENELIAVATDGRRLVKARESLDEPPKRELSVIVPQNSMKEMVSLLEDKEAPVYITFSEGQIFIDFDNTFVFSRVIDGKYPNYEVAIPKSSDVKLLVEKDIFKNAIKRALIMAMDKETPDLLKVDISNLSMDADFQGSIKIMTNSVDVGDADEVIYIKEMEGESLSLAFNGKYLLEILNLLSDDFLWILLSTPLTPVIIKSMEKENYTFIVMPVRLKKRVETSDNDVAVESYT